LTAAIVTITAVAGVAGTAGAEVMSGPQPDLQIRTAYSPSWVGDDVYETDVVSTQQWGHSLHRGERVAFDVKVQNDGPDAPAAFSISGPGTDANYRVKYKLDGVLVTGAVVDGSASTPPLAAQDWSDLRVVVKRRLQADPDASRSLVVTATGAAANTKSDSVLIQAYAV
jgi:hypothetical protein